MAFIDDILTFGAISGLAAREQDWLVDTQVFPADFEESFNDYKRDQEKYYDRAEVTATGSVLPLHDIATDLIYDRLWISDTINFELIVEEKTDNIAIWNAYLYSQKVITAFDDPGHTGIDVESVTLPTTLEPNEEAIYVVTVYPSGPAQQDTTYTYTVSGEELTIQVIGIRVLPFPFPVNWESGIKMEYGFKTILYQAPTTHEQRRSLHNTVRRVSTFDVLLSGIDTQKFNNLYRRGAARYFGVPIYSEVFTTSSILIGATAIIASDDITDFFNLQNYCDQIVIVDHSQAKAEIKVVTDITGQLITLEVPVVSSFDANETKIYPVYIGMLDQFGFKYETGGVITSSVSFREVFLGG